MKRQDRAAMLPNRYWTPQELLSLVACCRVVVSMRYHVCLFSALQHVPFVAIQRSDKVRDLCSDIQWPFGLPLGGLEVSALLDSVADIERQYEPLTERLQQAAKQRASASLKNNVALNVLTASVRSRESRWWLQ
jgi:polysaccharide pyruvyl transferase WcaK-like protein